MSDDHDDPIADPVEITTVSPVLVPPPRPPRARRRHSRRRYRIRRAIALLTLVVIGFGAWFAWELWQPFAGSGTGAVVVTIPAGLSARQIGDLLARAGVVDSGFFFRLRVSLDGDPRLRDGRVTLRHGMSYSAAIGVLTSTRPARHPVAATVRITIPEGFRRTEIAVLAHERGMSGSYMRASRRARGFHPRTYGAPRHVPSLEGFLFPATYYVTRGEPASDLVSQQLAAFTQNFNGLDFAHARAAGLSRYDVLIIASLVQAEAKVPSDFGKVAAVIYNRLHAGMRLQIESTVRYFLGDFTQPISDAQLAIANPFNTYVNAGLPPTPIGNPGLAAMVAAAHPAGVSYLYYVNKPYTCGKLAFATTDAQFLAEQSAYATARAKNGYREPSRCP